MPGQTPVRRPASEHRSRAPKDTPSRRISRPAHAPPHTHTHTREGAECVCRLTPEAACPAAHSHTVYGGRPTRSHAFRMQPASRRIYIPIYLHSLRLPTYPALTLTYIPPQAPDIDLSRARRVFPSSGRGTVYVRTICSYSYLESRVPSGQPGKQDQMRRSALCTTPSAGTGTGQQLPGAGWVMVWTWICISVHICRIPHTYICRLPSVRSSAARPPACPSRGEEGRRQIRGGVAEGGREGTT